MKTCFDNVVTIALSKTVPNITESVLTLQDVVGFVSYEVVPIIMIFYELRSLCFKP